PQRPSGKYGIGWRFIVNGGQAFAGVSLAMTKPGRSAASLALSTYFCGSSARIVNIMPGIEVHIALVTEIFDILLTPSFAQNGVSRCMFNVHSLWLLGCTG